MRVVALADTHLRKDSSRDLSRAAQAELERAEVILHAGDVTDESVLQRLARLAPVHAVLGNNDHDLVGVLPEELVVDLAGAKIAMIHDSGPRRGREARLHRRFPDAALVVFGHSHVPWDGPGLGGQWLLNPGSPTQRRAQPHRTLATVDLEAGRVVSTRIVNVD
jgi:uncharacterized protein